MRSAGLNVVDVALLDLNLALRRPVNSVTLLPKVPLLRRTVLPRSRFLLRKLRDTRPCFQALPSVPQETRHGSEQKQVGAKSPSFSRLVLCPVVVRKLGELLADFLVRAVVAARTVVAGELAVVVVEAAVVVLEVAVAVAVVAVVVAGVAVAVVVVAVALAVATVGTASAARALVLFGLVVAVSELAAGLARLAQSSRLGPYLLRAQ